MSVYSKVDGDHGFEEEGLEVVCGVTDDVEENGGHVYCHEVAQKSSSQDDRHLDRVVPGVETGGPERLFVVNVPKHHHPPHKVLCQFSWSGVLVNSFC